MFNIPQIDNFGRFFRGETRSSSLSSSPSPYRQVHDPETPEANYRVQMERCYICAAYEKKIAEMQRELNTRDYLIDSLAKRLLCFQMADEQARGKHDTDI